MANGLLQPPPGDLPLWEDVRHIDELLIASRRAFPPEKWVTDLVRQSEIDSFAGLF